MGYKVLVADDDPALRTMYKAFLEFEGYDVITAKNGDEAVKLYESGEDLDIIIMDYEMGPDSLNGVEATRQIVDVYERTSVYDNGDDAPKIIMCTGHPDYEQIKIGAEQAGISAFFVKPFNFTEILECIDMLLPKYSIIPPTPIPNSFGYDSYAHNGYTD
jgi:CheY-like chemotaxis protein